MQIDKGLLITSSVSIQSAEYGMRAYINSARGRAELTAECPPEIVMRVLEVWGPEPTVTEPVYPDPEPGPPTVEDRLSAAEDLLLSMLGVI